MTADIEQVTRLQSLDLRIVELEREIATLPRHIALIAKALDSHLRKLEAEKAAVRERTAQDQKELEQYRMERKELVSRTKPQTYSAYERVRKKWRGTAVAEAAGGRCCACQIVLRPQFFQDLRNSGELMFCESFGRILYYNPPVSFEHHVAVHPHR